MVHRYFEGVLPAATTFTEADLNVQAVAAAAVADADAAIEKVAVHDAIAAIWTLVDELNNYITVQEPWVLAKDDSNRERLGTVLNTTIEGLRVLAVLLNPITPKAAAKLWDSIGSSLGSLASQPLAKAGNWAQLKSGSQIAELEALFPRLEVAEEK
jgi:methionyl-tRNA synthetase